MLLWTPETKQTQRNTLLHPDRFCDDGAGAHSHRSGTLPVAAAANENPQPQAHRNNEKQSPP